jgi:multisubunit Na+/H+ antiporter MnhF subunit
LLPLTLLVLIVYLVVIPFNFMQPFRNREVLIIYNAGLFAVMALLVGVTPVHEDDLPQKYHAALRTGILAVAILAALISLYALSATVYRTVLGGLTVNRVTVIGWNGINIAILVLLIYKQFKHGATVWVHSLQSAFSTCEPTVHSGHKRILTVPTVHP